MPNNSSTAKLSTKLSLDLQAELDRYEAMPVPSNLQTLDAVKEHVLSHVIVLKNDLNKKKFQIEFDQLSLIHKSVNEKDALTVADKFFQLEDKIKKSLEVKDDSEITLKKSRPLLMS